MKGVAERTMELMNEFQKEQYVKSYHDFQHFLVVKIEELEDDKRRGSNIVYDLIETMKQPAIRGSKTTLQMCRFMDVWITDLEDALSHLREEQSNVR